MPAIILQKKYVVVLLFICAIAGCSREPQDQSYVEEQPNAASISGKWELTKPSFSFIKKYSNSIVESENCSIFFYPDGRYKIINFPVVRYYRKNDVIKTESTEGKWRFDFFHHWMVVVILPDGFGFNLDIRGKNPLYLTHTIGEPDSSETIVFAKE